MHPEKIITRISSALVRGARTASLTLTAMMVCGPLMLEAAHAQGMPDTDNGRFALSPVTEGYLRLDTRTGAVSICTDDGGWICRVVPDERAALDTEIGRLQTDNKRLKDELAQRDTVSGKIDAPLPKEDSRKSAQAPPDKKPELQLPPEHEKLMALLDRVWDRLIEMAVRLQKRLSEKI